ncbi:MGS207 protein [Seiridium cupressi]
MKFFDSEVKKCDGDWKAALHDYIYAGPKPLINGFSGGRIFKGLFGLPGFNNIATFLSNRESAVLRHWNGWTLQGEPIQQLEECMYAATMALIESANSAGGCDFFIAHILTVGHALRVLFPLMPAEHQNTVMREYGLYSILVYIAQLRPKGDQTQLDAEISEECSWGFVCKQTLDIDFSYDVHFAKVVRALKAADETWGGQEEICT